MDFKRFSLDLKARAGVGTVFQAIMVCSLLTNILMGIGFATMDKTIRMAVVPPEITKTFWFDGRKISQEYLEQMGTWIIDLYATVTPANIDYRNGLILKYVHPTEYGELSVRFKTTSRKIKRDNLSKHFQPREIRISEESNAVVLIGVQDIWVGDKRVLGNTLKAFYVAFHYDGSKVTIKELRETDPKRPFDPIETNMIDGSLNESTIITTTSPPSANPDTDTDVPETPESTKAPDEQPGLPPAPLPSTQFDINAQPRD